MKVGIIDLNTGNLLSMVAAINKAGWQTQVLQKPSEDVDVLVLPGQGRFGFVASQLETNNWREFILNWVAQGKLLIGVCVGMQLLFESSQEDIQAKGLGIMTGTVEKLQHTKTPMVGWAQLNSEDSFYRQKYVYFVNSYAIADSQYCSAWVNYGNKFCAIVQKNNVFGFQFHPEKSGDYGLALWQHILLGNNHILEA